MRVHFAANAWDDYQYWIETDPATLARFNALIQDVQRNPFTRLGKPEPLKLQLAGWWSRRISGEHRLVYRVEDRPGSDQRLEILMGRFRYS